MDTSLGSSSLNASAMSQRDAGEAQQAQGPPRRRIALMDPVSGQRYAAASDSPLASDTARRILKTLQGLSSPLSDASR